MGQNHILQVHRRECLGIFQLGRFDCPGSRYLVLAGIRTSNTPDEPEKEVERSRHVQHRRLVSIIFSNSPMK